MSCNKTIRSLLVGFLLVLFALNITPRHWLHLVVTGHNHHALSKADGVGYQKSKPGFNCSCDDQFTESPFESPVLPAAAAQLRIYSAPKVVAAIQLSSLVHLHTSLRGPPSMA